MVELSRRLARSAGLALTRSRQTTSWVLGQPQIFWAVLMPTWRCNLHCTYCGLPQRGTSELTTAQWFEIIDELADLGCRRVTLSGGEPLLRPDLEELIDRVRSRTMSCVLLSNGVAVSSRLQQLRWLNALVLSLDGVGEANDRVRGPGVYAAVQEAIAAARQIHLPLKLNAVLSSPTAPGLDSLLAFADAHHLGITVGVMRSGSAELYHQATRLKAADGEIRETLLCLARLARTRRCLLYAPATYQHAARWPDYSRDRIESDAVPVGDRVQRQGPRCHAGREYLVVQPDGRVAPCALTIGDSSSRSATEGVAAAWRSLHSHHCVTCYAPCWVDINYFFSMQPQVVLNFLAKNARFFA